MPARWLRHSLELARGSCTLWALSHFEAGHRTIYTVNNRPNRRWRTIGPSVRILLIFIFKELALRHKMFLQVLLLRRRITYPQMVHWISETRLLVRSGHSRLCCRFVHKLEVLIIRCGWNLYMMSAPLRGHCYVPQIESRSVIYEWEKYKLN